mgnify:CR=1 FL=1
MGRWVAQGPKRIGLSQCSLFVPYWRDDVKDKVPNGLLMWSLSGYMGEKIHGGTAAHPELVETKSIEDQRLRVPAQGCSNSV